MGSKNCLRYVAPDGRTIAEDFTARDFRTWAGTVLTAEARPALSDYQAAIVGIIERRPTKTA